jgi:beta-lactam-binding protein with PASTA domain
VVVSKGADLVTVPNLVGMSQTDAQAALAAVGLKLGDVTQGFSDSVAKGQVASQSPESGAQVEKDSTVSIVISKGTETVTVPNVKNMTQDAATQALSAVGLKAQPQTKKTSDPTLVGKVIDQSPAANETVPKGSNVTIVVGKTSNKGKRK